MRPVSAQFLAAVQSSHRLATRVRVVTVGQNGTNPTGTEIPIESGSVTLDITAVTRGTCNLVAAQSWPASATDLATPYGNEVFIERGVTYGDGSREWVSQGYFRIDSVEQPDAPYGALTITGSDRMSTIRDARITTPVTFAAGTTVLAVIQNLVFSVAPWAVLDYDASLATSTLGASQTTTDDRFGFLDDLITSYGMVWYWDHRGYLYIHFPPSPNVPILTVKAGQGGVLVSVSRTLSRTGIYNGVVASGQAPGATGAVVSATVINNDPNSPTFWYGAFGKVPQFFNSSFLQTAVQCVAAAQSILILAAGLPYNVDFDMVPNPAIEPLDCVQLTYPTRNELHVLEKVVIPLDAGSAEKATTRQQTTGVFTP